MPDPGDGHGHQLEQLPLSVDAVETNSQSYVQEIIKQVNSNIQSYIDNMENISMLAMTNKDVKYYISDNSFISKSDRMPYEKRISDLFQAILYSRKDISAIMVFGYNGFNVSDLRITLLNPYVKLEEQSWYKEAKRKGGQSVISPPHVQNIIQNEYRWVVSLSRELKSTDGIRGEGIFLVDLNLSIINDICSQINMGKRGTSLSSINPETSSTIRSSSSSTAICARSRFRGRRRPKAAPPSLSTTTRANAFIPFRIRISAGKSSASLTRTI